MQNEEEPEDPPAIFMTPRKKKTLKVGEQLDDSFLRRSKRLSKKAEGYKDAKTAKEAKKSVEVDDEPMPLAMIPPLGNVAAPHLSQEILQGIGQGFLKI